MSDLAWEPSGGNSIVASTPERHYRIARVNNPWRRSRGWEVWESTRTPNMWMITYHLELPGDDRLEEAKQWAQARLARS